jgi:hypothetical protein
MARGRILGTCLSTSERFARLFDVVPDLAEFCQSLYPLINSHADDFGRQQGDVFTVKMRVLPASPRKLEDFGRALAALNDVDLIDWYVIDGRQFIQIVKFEEHQSALHKRTASKFPEVPGTFRNTPKKYGKFTGIPPEEKRREGKRREEIVCPSSAPSADSGPASTVVLTFPLHDSESVATWNLTSEHVTRLQAHFPTLDVVGQCRHALAWVEANPRRRKTADGMKRFIAAWLKRETRPRKGDAPAVDPRRTHRHPSGPELMRLAREGAQ